LLTNNELISYGRDALTGSVDDEPAQSTVREQHCTTTLDLKSPEEATNAYAQPYQYQQLRGADSTRLLRFLAGSNDADIRCTINEYDMTSETIPYVALSYVWGDATIQHPIYLDGKTVNITSNLREALAHLWKTFPHSSFWIDAMCIDQDNLEERMHQVGQMRAIYSNAAEVVVWLGPGHEELERLNSKIESHDVHCFSTGLGVLYRGCGYQMDSGIIAAMRHLIRQKYWSRVWIIQEVTTARKVKIMCGTVLLDWLRFTQFLYDFCFDHFFIPEELAFDQIDHQARSLPIIRLCGWTYGVTFLAYALHWSETSLATDRRDKVYAILGLVNAGNGQLLAADYTLSPCNVYCLALRAMWRDCKSRYFNCDMDLEVSIIPKVCLENALERDRVPADRKVYHPRRKSKISLLTFSRV